MREYEVFTAARDIQIFNGKTADGEEIWTDCERDLLLNVVYAENEYEAVEKVAEQEGISDTSRMYAVQHIISAFVGEKRLEADSYVFDNLAGIHIELMVSGKEAQEVNVEVKADSDISMLQVTKDNPLIQQKDKNFYLLHWNDEYLDMQICAGPGTKSEMQASMKECLIKRLVECKIASDKDAAAIMYDETIGSLNESDELHIYENGASINYGYEDRYQIVVYSL